MDQPFQSQRNRLLELLPANDFDRLRAYLEPVPLDYKFELYRAGKPIAFVYFPVTGVASIVTTMMDGSAAEVGTVGNEGMVGLPIILGDTVAPNDAYVQVPGTALRMPASALREALNGSSTMATVILHYVHALFNQIAQTAACNCFHTVEQRCCRWLLMTHDRVQSNQFSLTQEFLGMMLGVRRTSITLAANQLKRQDLIKYSRGHVTVTDRAALEQQSCECYAVSKREFDRLLGPPHGPAAGRDNKLRLSR
ncbi:MAG TPA: Crp/Fnr family transcriptional regulator [Xanthobacteraceae bacterium]|jgi:CRP-like cAMP-binding protein